MKKFYFFLYCILRKGNIVKENWKIIEKNNNNLYTSATGPQWKTGSLNLPGKHFWNISDFFSKNFFMKTGKLS